MSTLFEFESSPLIWHYLVSVKLLVKISSIFVAFLENTSFDISGLLEANKTDKKKTMVFCYQNCFDLLWEKIVLVIEKNFWNSRLKAKNLKHFWDHLNNLFKQWKVRTISGNRMLF